MLVSTTTIVAVRCAVCGKMDFHAMSLFSFAGKKVHRLTCSCGAGLMSLGSKDRRQFWLQLECLMCESRHIYYYNRQELWSGHLIVLTCEETDLAIGYIGSKEQVRKSILQQDKSVQEMAEDLGFVDYFENPEIMYEVLENLQQLAEDGRLSCQCGCYQINVEVFPDRLELRCENCDAVGLFYAESDCDLDAVKYAGEIRLPSTYLAKEQPKLKKKGKKRSK